MIDSLNNFELLFKNLGLCEDSSRIIVIIIMCIVSSLLVLISHFSLYKIFTKDLLKIGGEIKVIHLLWCLGTIVTYLILYFLNLISYTLQSMVVVAFTWNFLLETTFNRLTDDKPKEVSKTISEIYNDDDDFK